MKRFIVILILFLGCDSVTAPEINETQLVQEVVLNSFMRYADTDTLFKYYFVAFMNLDTNNRIESWYDPPQSFIEKFSHIAVPVRPVSEMLFENGGTVLHKETRERAAMMWTTTVQLTSTTSARAPGGFICGGLCADTYMFYLTKTANGWAIDSTDWLWSW